MAREDDISSRLVRDLRCSLLVLRELLAQQKVVTVETLVASRGGGLA